MKTNQLEQISRSSCRHTSERFATAMSPGAFGPSYSQTLPLLRKPKTTERLFGLLHLTLTALHMCEKLSSVVGNHRTLYAFCAIHGIVISIKTSKRLRSSLEHMTNSLKGSSRKSGDRLSSVRASLPWLVGLKK